MSIEEHASDQNKTEPRTLKSVLLFESMFARGDGIMRTMLAFMLLAAAVLPTWSLAQRDIEICDRTPQVRDAIRRAYGTLESNQWCITPYRRRHSIRSLDLRDVSLTTLKPRDFLGLRELTTLDMANNYLTGLPPGVFDHLVRLETLNLSDNYLSALPEGVFDFTPNLNRLNLSRNKLTNFPEGVFDFTESLEFLHLTGNHLVGFSELDLVFDNLPPSRKVYLSGQTEVQELPAIGVAAVPLLVSATNSMRQGFVRIINETNATGRVRILAVDDGGNAAAPVEIPLRGNRVTHLNAGDIEDGNRNKGITAGIGPPARGNWRLGIETNPLLDVRALAYVRTNDGFLTAMHDTLQRDDRGRLVAITFNPATNRTQASRLRLINVGGNAETIAIEGVDDVGHTVGPVRLTLSAGESRTLSALDLEEGAPGLTGTLGDGTAKWRLFISAGSSVLGMNLLESPSGHLTNISTMGVATED